MKIRINEERCKSCGLCVAFCPKKVLYISDKRNLHGYKVVAFNAHEKCTMCGVCYLMCPDVVFERVGEDD